MRLIAERTSFQTEEQSTAVLACIDEHAADDDGEVPTAEDVAQDVAGEDRAARRERLRAELAELDDESDPSAVPEPSHSPGIKANDRSPVPGARFDAGREQQTTDAPRKAATTPVKAAPAKRAGIKGR